MDRRTDNVVDIQRSNERFFPRDSRLRVGEEPALASHLVTARALYSHHGIYVGNRRVIHYAGPSHGLCRGPVEDVSLEYFAHGRGIRVRHDRPRFDRREVVARARSRLGERSYRILTNNCEHFCEWCLNGASRSTQVERLLSGARRFACALLGTLGLAAGTPTFADPASQLAARVVGEGPTTIVLVAGLGDTQDVWADVQPLIAANCARTFAYTRAGYEGSAPANGPRDAASAVAELRAELQRREIPPPYVLVGHSLGGLYMQYFAREFANEVSGLLLVDSTHWNEQLPSTLGATSAYQPQMMFLYISLIMRRELADSALAGEQVHASPPAGDLPTIVLSRTGSLRGETPDSRLQAARLQREIAADFPAAVHVRVEGSGHYIQRDRPDVVINSARELAGCSPAVAPLATREARQSLNVTRAP